jgi:CheY-like chemotaxis protein
MNKTCHKPIAIIATPEKEQMDLIIDICNKTHLITVGVTTLHELINIVQEQKFSMLIISDKISRQDLCDQILRIRNKSIDKYLPVIAISSHAYSEAKIKPLLSAPFDILTDPVHSSILTCKIHLLLTLEHQKQKIQKESHKSARALSAKKAFLESTSHDIRTPINLIIGMSDLLMGDKRDTKQTKYLLNIRRSAEMLLALFNTKIDYGNIQSGSLVLESKVFEPMMIIQKIEAMLSSYLLSKRTELVTNIDSALPLVLLGDPARFEQILFNILFVSIQQTINNSITLNIRVHSKQLDQITLFISVEDDSMDFNEMQINTIKDDSESDLENIHVGLFVSKHIVQAMDGNIGFSANNNNHSEIWCTVSLAKTSLNTEKKYSRLYENSRDSINYSLFNTEDIRILLVEDSPINQMIEKSLLKKLGFKQIDIVENGEEAVNILTKQDYDLVLMDIIMPVMNGLEASRLIRNQNSIRNQNIPIIALTAQDTYHLETDFEKYKINYYLSKPIDLDKLTATIKKCFPRLDMFLSKSEDIKPDIPNQVVETPKKPIVNNVPLFDRNALLERLDGDEALYQELVEGFLADIPVQVNKLEKALDFDDLLVAGQLAHTLKGAFSNLGAQLLQNIAKELENDIKNIDMKHIKQRIGQLKQSLKKIKKLI